jgi:hypothetical protein
VLSRASCFDGGVEREQVGLLSDVVDDLDDIADLSRILSELFDLFGRGLDGGFDHVHCLDRFPDGVRAYLGGVGSLNGSLGNGLRVDGNLLDRIIHLSDGRC